MAFTTTSLTDADGNIYNTITIGTQVWMKENLKTTKYNDGTPIPNITDNTAWEASTTTFALNGLMAYDDTSVHRGFGDKRVGVSVRCVMDF